MTCGLNYVLQRNVIAIGLIKSRLKRTGSAKIIAIFIGLSINRPADAGITFGPCERIGAVYQARHGEYSKRMQQYQNKVSEQIIEHPAPVRGRAADHQQHPKSREQFLSELNEAKQRNNRMFEDVKVHEHLSRIDSRPPDEIAQAGGILGGNPNKPVGTLYEHTVMNSRNNSHGTSSYTSTTVGKGENNYFNEFLLGVNPTKVILKTGETIENITKEAWFAMLRNESLVQELRGGVAIWESYVYHGFKVEGVKVVGGSNVNANK